MFAPEADYNLQSSSPSNDCLYVLLVWLLLTCNLSLHLLELALVARIEYFPALARKRIYVLQSLVIGLNLLLVGLPAAGCRLLERLSFLLPLNHSIFKLLVKLDAYLSPADSSGHTSRYPSNESTNDRDRDEKLSGEESTD